MDLYPMGTPRDALDITYPLPNGLKEGWRCQAWDLKWLSGIRTVTLEASPPQCTVSPLN